MTRDELKKSIYDLVRLAEQSATLHALWQPKDGWQVKVDAETQVTLLREKILQQIDEMYAGAAPDESFEPPMPDSPPPDGSVWYYCSKCKKHVLSAGGECPQCDYKSELNIDEPATDPRYIQQDIDLEAYRLDTYDNYGTSEAEAEAMYDRSLDPCYESDMTQAYIDEVNAIADQAEACCSYCDTPLSEIPNHLMRFHKDGKCEDMDTQEMQESHEIQMETGPDIDMDAQDRRAYYEERNERSY